MAYDKVVDSGKLDSAMTATADAIRGKTGGVEGIAWDESTGFADAVDGIEVGRMPVVEKDVNFYDYDGTLLYSYTVAEAQALTELPTLPEQSGLICQGWNWGLEDIKAHNRKVNVGANYITDDGKTRLYIELPSANALDVSILLKPTVANGVVVDWGDGSEPKSVPFSGGYSISHTYSAAGKYVISFEVVSGELMLGNGEAWGITTVHGNKYSGMYKVEVGNGVTYIPYNSLRSSTFRYISLHKDVKEASLDIFNGSQIEFVALPKGLTFGKGIAMSCACLERCCLPSTFSGTLPGRSFYACARMTNITIPDGVTEIGHDCFGNNYGLSEITIPRAVANIGTKAFSGCNRLLVIRFLPEVPPVVENADAFTGIPTTCIVEVPAGSLTTYQNATNYGTIAAQMVGCNL